MPNILVFRKEKTKLYYSLVFIVLAIYTDPFFIGFKGAMLIPFLLLGFISLKQGVIFDRKIVLVIAVVVILIVLQGVLYGFKFLSLLTYVSFTIITPYFLYRIFGVKLFKYFVNIIYFFSITSLVLWTLQNISPPVDDLLQNLKNTFHEYSSDRWPRSIIIYTVAITKAEISIIDVYRNSGIFHEPGGYATWLILAIGLNTILQRNPFNFKNLLFSISLITTFSTAGYLQFFILLSFVVSNSRMNIVFKVLLFSIFLFASINIYQNAEFLQPKMRTHIEEESNIELEGAYTTGRIVRALKIINVIKQNPIVGRGIITASAEDNKFSAYYMSGTSSIKIFAHFGLLFGFLFFLYYYRGLAYFINLNNYDKKFTVFLLVSILLGGLSQDFFYDAISIQFFFVGLYSWKPHNNSRHRSSSRGKIPKTTIPKGKINQLLLRRIM